MAQSIANLLSTGEFSRLTGLSVKALRLYDLSGLLAPVAVDPVTGYRRYSAGQVERARRISLLRHLDMPLSTIGELLADEDDRPVDGLDAWWAGQEASQRERRATYEFLRAALLRGTVPWSTHPVSAAEVPAVKLASIRSVVDQAALVPAIIELGQDILGFLTTAGASPTGGHWVIYHDAVSPETEGEIEVAVPFEGAAEPAGPVGIRIEAAHTFASCTITRTECNYPAIMLAYEDVEVGIRQSGWSPVGPPREVYLGQPCELGADDAFALVGRPVEGVS